jgi:hypothetical protein
MKPAMTATILVLFASGLRAQEILEPATAFKPSWSFQAALTHSTQEGGQVSNDLSLTATWDLSEAGHYLSGGLSAGNKRLEGDRTPYGSLSVGGGLGLGIFTPSLTLTAGGGRDSYGFFDSALGFDFRVADPLSLSLTLNRQWQEHSTTWGEFLGYTGLYSDSELTIGSSSWGGILGATIRAFDWLDFSLSAGRSTNETEGIRDERSGREARNIGGTGETVSGTAGLTFRFLRAWNAGVSYQKGRDSFPDELYFSQRLGRTLALTGGEVDWDGSSVWLGYNF